MRNTITNQCKQALSLILRGTGLMDKAQWIRSPYRPQYRQFKKRYGSILGHNLSKGTGKKKVALICSVHVPEVFIEMELIKALELAGYIPLVLVKANSQLLPKYYKLAGVKKIYDWGEFVQSLNIDEGRDVLDKYSSLEQLLTYEYKGVRVGRFASCTAVRWNRLGALHLDDTQDREFLAEAIARSMACTRAAESILKRISPDLVVMTDKGYSPKGELLDKCLAKGIDVIDWALGYKSNTLLLKRFNRENRDMHTNSLSKKSWNILQQMEWTEDWKEKLQQEFHQTYARGDWYSVAGTQFNKRLLEPHEIKSRLGLDPQKKTAFIFSHIFWDAWLFWKGALFQNYEEWLIETVRAACANDQVNWVIKIHPANLGKAAREGFSEEPGEQIAIRKHIGTLPPHVKMIPANSDICTFSLFDVMDYCLTVRGRVGMEAASRGIPTLTAGTGPYDHRGFTIDSETREEYLEKVSRIHEINPLSPFQEELAQRFAFGFFMLRSLPLSSVSLEYHKSSKKHLAEGHVNIRTKEDWVSAADMKAIAQWVGGSDDEDFLLPIGKKEDGAAFQSLLTSGNGKELFHNKCA
ncbi:hypothetical protein [Candidatus Nitronereus thalassa]|uniref:Capsule polysaccharide biosynthesis protein n=1 Tax=Candidatus Nitronereus thalassa TaxID=3020898 RepID=A0ABU3K5D4_9BACT|nr:hypothetical protein [Candidatus Nitronereus thalassa]MDT7041570.1 hypothetical protein [Candidatus Nitronereus thalassa]